MKGNGRLQSSSVSLFHIPMSNFSLIDASITVLRSEEVVTGMLCPLFASYLFDFF